LSWWRWLINLACGQPGWWFQVWLGSRLADSSTWQSMTWCVGMSGSLATCPIMTLVQDLCKRKLHSSRQNYAIWFQGSFADFMWKDFMAFTSLVSRVHISDAHRKVDWSDIAGYSTGQSIWAFRWLMTLTWRRHQQDRVLFILQLLSVTVGSKRRIFHQWLFSREDTLQRTIWYSRLNSALITQCQQCSSAAEEESQHDPRKVIKTPLVIFQITLNQNNDVMFPTRMSRWNVSNAMSICV